MKKMGVEPELKDYCLLLRAVNECGIGDPELAKHLLLDPDTPSSELETRQISDDRNADAKMMDTFDRRAAANESKKKRKMLKMYDDIDTILAKYVDDGDKIGATAEDPDESHHQNMSDISEDIELKDNEEALEIPDNLEWWQMDVFLKKRSEDDSTAVAVQTAAGEDSVLDPKADFPEGIPLSKVRFRKDRLALIGGYQRILQALVEKGIKPDIVFFMQLMLSVPAQEEDNLLDEMDMANVRPDITFYNLLLKKRAVRGDYGGAKKLMKLIEDYDLVPDIRTYGCLALTCKTYPDGSKLLRSMEEAGVEPNVEIMTALLTAGGLKFRYLRFLLSRMESIGIRPGNLTLDTVERKISQAKLFLAEKEKDPESDFDTKYFGEQLLEFVEFYDDWCQRTQLAKEDHPWASFRSQKETSPKDE